MRIYILCSFALICIHSGLFVKTFPVVVRLTMSSRNMIVFFSLLIVNDNKNRSHWNLNRVPSSETEENKTKNIQMNKSKIVQTVEWNFINTNKRQCDILIPQLLYSIFTFKCLSNEYKLQMEKIKKIVIFYRLHFIKDWKCKIRSILL